MWEEDSDNNISDNALTLNLQAYGAEASSCSSSEELCNDSSTEEGNGSPKQRTRKRKRSEEEVEDGDDEDTDVSEEIDMPAVVHQMEAEIERQLDAKAKKSNLTVANVKNILKDVITNEDVLDLVRHTMKQPEKNFCISKVFSYAPKLTRAKTRELLNTFPSMAWPITPSKNVSTSKCKVLIEQELPEDSSDEEYQPDEDEDQDDVEKQKQDSSFGNDDQDEEEQADSDEADAQGDEEEEEDEEEDDDDDDDCDEDEQELNQNSVHESVTKCNIKSTEGEDDDDDDDDCRLVICDNDNDGREVPSPNKNTGSDVNSMYEGNSSKNTVINNTATQTSWPEVNGKKPQNQAENSNHSHSEKNSITTEENICQRTRSKFSLSDTPLETIESAFMPPDITTDMYDSECDDEDWKNFLKGFTEPLKPDTQDAPDDDENDPEYNIMADEEDADDKEELREDRGVKVSRKEVNALMAELCEYIGMLSDETDGPEKSPRSNESAVYDVEQRSNEEELKDIVEHIAGALEQHTEENVHLETLSQTNKTLTTTNETFCPTSDTVSHENETTEHNQETPSSTTDKTSPRTDDKQCEVLPDQKMVIEQQIRMYVQFQTQHFLLTYLHPIYHVYSMDCKQNLLVLKQHARNNKNSSYYAANLDDAIALLVKWEQLHSSEDAKKRYMDFMDKEIELQNIMKKRRRFHRGKFPPGFFEIVCNSTVFMYPAMLPTNPFRCDGHSTTRFFKSEDVLIALGLEYFMKYAKENPKVWGKVTVPKVVPMIVEHFLPARKASSVYTRILECANMRQENNPIRHFFEKKSAPRTTHYVVPLSGTRLPPCQQLHILPEVWRDYILSKNLPNTGRNVVINYIVNK